MSDQQPPSDDLERQCRRVASRIAGQHGWELLDRVELARRAAERAGGGAQLEPAVIGAYCQALHAACSGAEGASRQNQGYAELSRYLYSIVAAHYADLPGQLREEAVQSALERIYKAFERSREPVAFFAFAGQHLLDAVRQIRRQEYRPVDSIQQLAGEQAGSEAALPDPKPPPLELVLIGDQQATIELLLAEFAAAHPRAAQQVAILRMQWIERLDDATISRRLGISLSSVYTARSRITKTMQAEPHWQARARELGLFADEV